MDALPTPVLVAAIGAVTALAAATGTELLLALLRRKGRRPTLETIARRVRWPWRLFLLALVVAATVAAIDEQAFDRPQPWLGPVTVAARVLVVVAVMAIALSGVRAMEDMAARKLPLSSGNNRRARRAMTQLAMVRRVAQLVIVVVGSTILLASWQEGRTLGTSLLASAGLVGLAAGLAAQSTLANVLAGLQLTFTDALRIDDVVVVEGEWGRIEEITLTYIVVAIWDDRRLVLPSSYFVSTPFQHWTRTESRLLGSTVMRFDYTVDVAAMRRELERFLPTCEWYDGRGWALQAIDDDGETVQIRALATSVDGPAAWELRCAIREHLLAWVRDHQPGALPRRRLVGVDEVAGMAGPAGGERSAPADQSSSGSPTTTSQRSLQSAQR